MYQISKEEFKKILDAKSIAIVGEQCKRVEMIGKDRSVPMSSKCDLIKRLIKEIVYESIRDLELEVKCFSTGMDYFKVNMSSSEVKKND